MKNKSEIEKMIKEKIDCLKCLEKNAKILYLESIIDKLLLQSKGKF